MAEPREFEYKGHHVSISVIERGKYWHWSYVIDRGVPIDLRGRGLRHEESALAEAKSHAERFIDNMA